MGQARLRGWPLVSAVVAIVLALATLTHLRAREWSDPLTQMTREVQAHPASARSQYAFGRLSIAAGQANANQAWIDRGREAIARASELRPNPRAYLAYGALLKLSVNSGDDEARDVWLARSLAHPDDRVPVEVFVAVVKCQAYADCVQQPDVVLSLADGLLGRESLAQHWHRQVLEWLAIYYLRVLDDAAAGLSILRELVETRPSDQRRVLRLAEALAATGDTLEAGRLARQVMQSFKWHSPITERPQYRQVQRLIAATQEAHDR